MNTTTITPPVQPLFEADYLARMQAARAASWPPAAPREPVWPLGRRPFGDLLRERARRMGDRTAVIFHGARMSWAELDGLSERFANLLRGHGVSPGDRVAVWLPNCPQYLIVFHGLMKLGAIHVPVNPMFKEPELRHELELSRARVIVTLDQLLGMVRAVEADHPFDLVLRTGLGDMLPAEPEGPLPEAFNLPPVTDARSLDLLAALAQASDLPVEVAIDLDAVAALNFTGGTTGLPKACTHSQADMLYTCATGGRLCYELDENSVVLCFVPLFWIAGEGLGLLMTVFFGSTLVLQTRWNPVGFTTAVERHGVTHTFMMVDSAMEILATPECDSHDLGTLKHVKTASFVNRITPDLRAAWAERTGAPLHEVSWGMTETHTYDFFTTGFQDGNRDLVADGTFVGLAVPETEVKILDFDTGVLQPPGVAGEIVIRSPSVTRGYWQPDGSVVPALDAGGWFQTGDIGILREDGTMLYLGRRKELIKVKGMSVYPSELEVVLAAHPAIVTVAVVPRPCPTRGQVPVAFVKLAEGVAVTPDELTAWVRPLMASYKMPEFRIIDSFPVTFSGKIRKTELVSLHIG